MVMVSCQIYLCVRINSDLSVLEMNIHFPRELYTWISELCSETVLLQKITLRVRKLC